MCRVFLVIEKCILINELRVMSKASAPGGRYSEQNKAPRSKLFGAPRRKKVSGTARGFLRHRLKKITRRSQVQGLGCRLGRCFCALHRGVHWTPAPCSRNQNENPVDYCRQDFLFCIIHFSLFNIHHSFYLCLIHQISKARQLPIT